LAITLAGFREARIFRNWASSATVHLRTIQSYFCDASQRAELLFFQSCASSSAPNPVTTTRLPSGQTAMT
jgi:hypothetical protein